MSDDDDLERMIADLTEMCRRSTNDRADEILSQPDTPIFDVLPGEAVLYGFDGQIEATMFVPDFPDALKRPIPRRPTIVECTDEPSVMGDCRVATYRRVGSQTYQREM